MSRFYANWVCSMRDLGKNKSISDREFNGTNEENERVTL